MTSTQIINLSVMIIQIALKWINVFQVLKVSFTCYQIQPNFSHTLINTCITFNHRMYIIFFSLYSANCFHSVSDRSTMKTLILSCVFLAALLPANSFKVVSILPFASNSHFAIGSAITKSLLNDGNQVTVISPYPKKKPVPNHRDIDVSSVLEQMKKGLKDTSRFKVISIDL